MKVIYYYQTLVGLKSILEEDAPTCTHIILSSIHFLRAFFFFFFWHGCFLLKFRFLIRENALNPQQIQPLLPLQTF